MLALPPASLCLLSGGLLLLHVVSLQNGASNSFVRVDVKPKLHVRFHLWEHQQMKASPPSLCLVARGVKSRKQIECYRVLRRHDMWSSELFSRQETYNRTAMRVAEDWGG
jgi:hypothetical protein